MQEIDQVNELIGGGVIRYEGARKEAEVATLHEAETVARKRRLDLALLISPSRGVNTIGPRRFQYQR
jgi:hypothetical protein